MNAVNAHRNAQDAQEKYAEQASNDADAIRRQANETKSAAHTLRSEADHLNGRVVATENRLSQISNSAHQDNSLTDEAKEKVILSFILQYCHVLIILFKYNRLDKLIQIH